MRDQHLLAELLIVAGRDHVGGDAAQIAVSRLVFGSEHKRHEARPWVANVEAELTREVIAERCRADLWNRKASGGDDERGRTELDVARAHDEFGGLGDFLNLRVEEDAGASCAAFFFEHLLDVAGRAIAE